MKTHLRELAKDLPEGYTIGFPTRKSGPAARVRKIGGHHAHPYVLKPDGTPLRDATGIPVKIATTPGNNRAYVNARAWIRRALANEKTHAPT